LGGEIRFEGLAMGRVPIHMRPSGSSPSIILILFYPYYHRPSFSS
jgi:hypothetical protein